MSHRGRKRKAGKRYPSGQRVTAGPAKKAKPAPDVVARRRKILGTPDAKGTALQAAENPLDTMAARGWLTGGEARAGHAYADLCRRAGHGSARVTANIEEAPESTGIDARRIQDMTHAEIAEIWAVVERRKTVGAGGDGDPKSTADLTEIWKALDSETTAELYSVCVLNSWPWWLVQKIAGVEDRDLLAKWSRRREVLLAGLRHVRSVLAPKKAKAIEPVRDHPFLGGPVVEETVVYVDENGQPDPVMTRRGNPVEVVRRRRA